MLKGTILLFAVLTTAAYCAEIELTGKSPHRHPACVADGALLQSLRSPASAILARQVNLLGRVVARLAEQARLNPKIRRPDPDGLEEWMARITAISLHAAIRKDEPSLAEARAWLAQATTLPPAAEDNYEYGAYAQGLAAAYDLLGPYLTDEQRSSLRNHLAAVADDLYLAFRGKRPGWWRGLYLHHDHWIAAAGLGIAGLVLMDEIPQAKDWYTFAKDELERVFSLLGKDGGWTEGPAPWAYGVSAIAAFYDAAERRTGEKLADKPWLARTARYALYTLLRTKPQPQYVVLHDSHPDGRYGGRGSTPAPLLFWLAKRYRDGYAQWLGLVESEVDQQKFAGATAAGRGPGPAIYTAAFAPLWCDPAVEPKRPDDLPRSILFPNLGLAVCRSGWSDEGEVLTFQCGPVGGHKAADWQAQHNDPRLAESILHVHANANAFTYYAAGRRWIVGAGYGFRDTGFQNTVTVDGGSQMWALRPGGRLLRYEFGDGYAYLLGDATRSWPEAARLDMHRRHLLWLKGQAMFVCDCLTTTDGLARYFRRYNWQVYVPTDLSAERRESRFILTDRKGGRQMLIDLVTNGRARYETAEVSLPGGYVRLKRIGLLLAGEVPPRTYIASLIQVRPAGSEPEPTVTAAGDGWVALARVRNDAATGVLFCLEPSKLQASRTVCRMDLPRQVERFEWWLVGLEPDSRWNVSGSVRAGARPQVELRIEPSGPVQASQAGLIKATFSR